MLSNEIFPPQSGQSIPVVRCGDRWIARVTYEEREIAKIMGFRWDPTQRVWYTTRENIARQAGDIRSTVRTLREREQQKSEALAASRAHDVRIEIPVPAGLSYLPYQRAGIAYALSHPSTLLADEMGLGKTIQAIGLINADPTIKRVLIICPASLRLNWVSESRKWLVRPMRIEIVTSKSFPATSEADIVVCNYDILSRHLDKLHGEQWDLLVADEAHYLKNPPEPALDRRIRQKVANPGRSISSD